MKELPVLTTNRLRLRELRADDIPRIVEYANNPKVSEMTLNIPHPYRPKDARWWIDVAEKGFRNKDHFIFAICLKSTNAFIGGIGLNIKEPAVAELGFWIGAPFWNQGFMTEALQKVLAFGFGQLALDEIYATHFLDNPASGIVMEKNGMVKKGMLKEHVRKNNKYRSVIQYRLTKKEFRNRDES